MPRSPLLKLMSDTLDSNRNWKSCYFFIEGDEWICHPGDQEYMPVDKTWGIMPPSGMPPSIFRCLIVLVLLVTLTVFFLQLGTVHKSHLNSGAFWEKKNFNKTKLSKRTWAKLVNLDTFHWYYDGPKPTVAARQYDCQVCQRKSIAQCFGYLSYFYIINS